MDYYFSQKLASKYRQQRQFRAFMAISVAINIILLTLLIAIFMTMPKVADGNTEKEINLKADQVEIIQVENMADQEIYIEAEKACAQYGMGKDCINDLRAIAAAETSGTFNCELVGDGGDAHGCFQINFHWPREISQAEAKDIKIAVNWTLDRLMSNGYKTNRDAAIRKHNGGVSNPKTLIYLNKVNRWKAELEN